MQQQIADEYLKTIVQTQQEEGSYDFNQNQKSYYGGLEFGNGEEEEKKGQMDVIEEVLEEQQTDRTSFSKHPELPMPSYEYSIAYGGRAQLDDGQSDPPNLFKQPSTSSQQDNQNSDYGLDSGFLQDQDIGRVGTLFDPPMERPPTQNNDIKVAITNSTQNDKGKMIYTITSCLYMNQRDIQVKRSYDDFKWLVQSLQSQWPTKIVPQLSGDFLGVTEDKIQRVRAFRYYEELNNILFMISQHSVLKQTLQFNKLLREESDEEFRTYQTMKSARGVGFTEIVETVTKNFYDKGKSLIWQWIQKPKQVFQSDPQLRIIQSRITDAISYLEQEANIIEQLIESTNINLKMQQEIVMRHEIQDRHKNNYGAEYQLISQHQELSYEKKKQSQIQESLNMLLNMQHFLNCILTYYSNYCKQINEYSGMLLTVQHEDSKALQARISEHIIEAQDQIVDENGYAKQTYQIYKQKFIEAYANNSRELWQLSATTYDI